MYTNSNCALLPLAIEVSPNLHPLPCQARSELFQRKMMILQGLKVVTVQNYQSQEFQELNGQQLVQELELVEEHSAQPILQPHVIETPRANDGKHRQETRQILDLLNRSTQCVFNLAEDELMFSKTMDGNIKGNSELSYFKFKLHN